MDILCPVPGERLQLLSRLMEQEGIYYYFKHVDGSHTVVIADSHSAHSPIEGYEEIPYIPVGRAGGPDRNTSRLEFRAGDPAGTHSSSTTMTSKSRALSCFQDAGQAQTRTWRIMKFSITLASI